MSTTAPGAQRARGEAVAGSPRLSLVMRNRPGSEIVPATIRRLALALKELPVEVIVADETLKIGSTELLAAARLEALPVRVVRARDALSESIASASGAYIAIADADERHPPEMLAEMLFEADSNDVDCVIAARRPPGARRQRAVVSACGAAVRGLSDPLAPFFAARKELVQGIGVRRTILALDVLLAHPNASVSELPIAGPVRTRTRERHGLRRRIAETTHTAALLRSGARARAQRGRARATQRALAVRRAAESPWVLPAMLAILAAAAALRFWALPSLHWYGHDEGHASLAAHRMLVEHRPVLTGQPTSRGVYLGPGYYYLLAPFYALFGMSPFAGAFLAAATGVLAVLLVFLIGRTVFGAPAGVAAAALFATAPIAVYFGRFGWNPNTLPFFGALFVYALLRAPERRRWLPVAAFCAGLAPQLHASGLLLPGALGIWLLTRRPRMRARGWIATGGAFALPLLPLIAAELRSGLSGTKSWARLLLGRGSSGAETGGSLVRAFKDVFVQSIGTPRFSVAAVIVGVAVIGLIVWERKHWNDRHRAPAFQTVAMVALVGVAGAVAWRGQILSYWLLPWLPIAVVLFAGGLVEASSGLALWLTRSRRTAHVTVVAAVALAASFNIAAVARPVRLAGQFDAASPAAFHNVAATADWIASRAAGTPYRLEVWTPFAWDRAHNSTFAFDYLLLRRGLRQTPGARTVFVVAMEDVATPRVHLVRADVLRAFAAVRPPVRPAEAAEFGGLSVYKIAA